MSARDTAAKQAADIDPDETIYVRNEEGAVHSVTRWHYDTYLTQTTSAGRKFPLPGWQIITEDDAKAEHPQLFGAPDESIVYTDDELIRALNREEALKKLRGGRGRAGRSLQAEE